MKQFRADPFVLRMAVDGKVELIMAVHVDDLVVADSDATCKRRLCHASHKIPH